MNLLRTARVSSQGLYFLLESVFHAAARIRPRVVPGDAVHDLLRRHVVVFVEGVPEPEPGLLHEVRIRLDEPLPRRSGLFSLAQSDGLRHTPNEVVQILRLLVEPLHDLALTFFQCVKASLDPAEAFSQLLDSLADIREVVPHTLLKVGIFLYRHRISAWSPDTVHIINDSASRRARRGDSFDTVG